MVTYTICLTPQIVSELTDAQPFIILHTKILVAFNSCLNPIIYGVNHPHFREVFKCIVFRRWKDIPKPVLKWMNNSRSKESVKESHSKLGSNVSLKFISRFHSQDVDITVGSRHCEKV
ncbi:hypothetical protein HOLleu_34908 [Holothuria leucospilota]|uniref:Uncharacterized protein n=1 Tax=Holothuria leucospilota TaxID=206669 RepID=A0A9Q1BH20_HOLLE|nr:hypothetical protein HOLleu_34908 [Holothuria leucospilota]